MSAIAVSTMPYMLTSQQSFQRYGSSDSWKNDKVEVKSLFLNGRYKQYALVSNRLSSDAEHPLHKLFLRFYQAICYEIMSMAAHCYSSNKLPLLDFARESFDSALAILEALQSNSGARSLPSTLQDVHHPFLHSTSPKHQCIGSTIVGSDPGQSRETSASPSRTDFKTERSRDRMETTTMMMSHAGNRQPPPQTRHTWQYDLNHTPETPRLLDEHRVSLAKEESVVRCPAENEALHPAGSQRVHVSQVQQPNLDDRPLPPLPFGRKPRFQKLGNRLKLVSVQRPKRFDEQVSMEQQQEHHVRTPVTPRLQYIARTFNPMQTDTRPEKVPQLSSHIRCEDAMITFRQCVAQHLAETNERIGHAIQAQREHKARQKNRLVSFWSFKLAGVARTVHPRQAALQERIAILKKGEWHVVKEKHGWKGQEYYDALRLRAERDLASRS